MLWLQTRELVWLLSSNDLHILYTLGQSKAKAKFRVSGNGVKKIGRVGMNFFFLHFKYQIWSRNTFFSFDYCRSWISTLVHVQRIFAPSLCSVNHKYKSVKTDDLDNTVCSSIRRLFVDDFTYNNYTAGVSDNNDNNNSNNDFVFCG